MKPLYTTRPGGMRKLNTILVAILAITLVGSLLLLLVEPAGALIALISLFVTLLVIFLILPRRYEIWPERLRLIFPLWNWDIGFESIKEVRAASAIEPYAFIGFRFATAPSQSVTIIRHKATLIRNPNLVVSPQNREEFLAQMRRAMRQGD